MNVHAWGMIMLMLPGLILRGLALLTVALYVWWGLSFEDTVVTLLFFILTTTLVVSERR